MQILRVLLTILDTSSDPRSLAVACYDLSQFIQYHAAGRVIVTDLKAKERVMKLMNHENAEVTKNALLCIQRLLLGAKYASFLQAWWDFHVSFYIWKATKTHRVRFFFFFLWICSLQTKPSRTPASFSFKSTFEEHLFIICPGKSCVWLNNLFVVFSFLYFFIQ